MRHWIITVTIVFAMVLLLVSFFELRTPTVSIGTPDSSLVIRTLQEEIRQSQLLQDELRDLKSSLDKMVNFLSENSVVLTRKEGSTNSKQAPKLNQQVITNNFPATTKTTETIAKAPFNATKQTNSANTGKQIKVFLKQRNVVTPGDTPKCMTRPLMLMSKQRSGFHFFRSLLDQHPKSRMGTEYFCRHVLSFRPTYGQIFRETRTLTPQQAKDYLQAQMFDRNYTAFTIQNGQQIFDFPFVPKIAKEMGFVAVHLVRRNIFAIEVSSVFDKLTHQPVCLVGEVCKAAETQVRMSTKTLLSRLEATKGFQDSNRQMLDEAGLDWIEIYYEDLVKNNKLICDVLQFLGCGCPELKIGTVQKIIRKPFSELISNWDEVVRTLKGTQFEYLLTLET